MREEDVNTIKVVLRYAQYSGWAAFLILLGFQVYTEGGNEIKKELFKTRIELTGEITDLESRITEATIQLKEVSERLNVEYQPKLSENGNQD